MTELTHVRDLRRKRPPNEPRVQEIKKAMALDMALNLVRERRGVTQQQLAETLTVSRPNISRIEHEEDLRLSTLDGYITALGGRLEIRAVFPDEQIQLA